MRQMSLLIKIGAPFVLVAATTPAIAAKYYIQESGRVSAKENVADQRFWGTPIAGLRYKASWVVDLDAPGISYSVDYGQGRESRYYTAGTVERDANGNRRNPSIGIIDWRLAIEGVGEYYYSDAAPWYNQVNFSFGDSVRNGVPLLTIASRNLSTDNPADTPYLYNFQISVTLPGATIPEKFTLPTGNFITGIIDGGVNANGYSLSKVTPPGWNVEQLLYAITVPEFVTISATPVPEPGSWMLYLLGLSAAFVRIRKSNKSQTL